MNDIATHILLFELTRRLANDTGDKVLEPLTPAQHQQLKQALMHSKTELMKGLEHGLS